MESGYLVTCECGQAHNVTAGAAGTHVACGCGRQVAVPSLQALRRSAGEPTVSAELEIRALLQDDRLPEEPTCLRCGAETADVGHALVVCERPEVQGTEWRFRLPPLLLGWLVWTRSGQAQERGRHVSFRLPLRLCRGCAARLWRSEVVELLRRVPVYGRLLEKYPHADVRLEREGR